MMMTAAGTIAAKVLSWASLAGLQAIATTKRMGAIVFAAVLGWHLKNKFKFRRRF